MRIMLNGEAYMTEALDLSLLKQEYIRKQQWQLAGEYVVIMDGFQTDQPLALSEAAEVTIIAKGKMPSKEALEHMMCARHTPHVHERVKYARVAVAGLGGLGSNIALMLARTGVGTLHLVDFDVVEPSNLNRQQYRITHLGMNKTDALAAEIKEINPYIRILTDHVRVTAENAAVLFGAEDIICEAFDGADQKAMLTEAVLTQLPGKYLVAASGMAGYDDCNQITTRKITDHFYICGDGKTGARPGCGLMAPRVAVCAGHQANQVLQCIMEMTDTNKGV